ncbi:hypothetical protein LX69_00555 [Breznakibacter xylanolyticus]|uniref:Uncharacterized protein n=1 Tax=Breznakibacter xylanolyticus TaxID=990 RepID=A0A2W7P9S5_9BACT|nr:hypothetical protein [Breznakibacter xylanolyticus]PZX20102.1 hypothetical protein LX69_00555 [Breznakibacter xylanolyticus]
MHTQNPTLSEIQNNQINTIYTEVNQRIDESRILLHAWSGYLNRLNIDLELNLSDTFIAVVPHLFVHYYNLDDVYVETAKYLFAEYVHFFILEPHNKGESKMLDSDLFTIAANIFYLTIPIILPDDPRITRQLDPNFDCEKLKQSIL